MSRNAGHHILSARTMERRFNKDLLSLIVWGVMLTTNILFVSKYIPRIGIDPIYASFTYSVLFIGLVWVYRRTLKKYITERIARVVSLCLAVGIIGIIACSILFIDPLTIRVDRWSATTYFLDALFEGTYPYGVHTHVSESNFPSPFPLWHYLNIPFWLMGDVGWIQAFMLLVFLGSLYLFSHSWRAVLSATLLLCISPSYWWEIATRSDGLSNALLVCSCILLMERFDIQMNNRWWLVAIIAGCIASTRLSAVIPIALYLFKPWLEVDIKKEIGFICVALGVVVVAFAPYIFWDTVSWVFFSRNPFMSQTGPGNTWILVVMMLIAIWIAYKKQTLYYYFCTTSIYMFIFMLVSQFGYIIQTGAPYTLFDVRCDISYFTLAIPFAIIALIYQKE